MDISIQNADINEQCSFSITRKFKIDLPSFGMLGNTERTTKMPSIDMHTVLRDLSKVSTEYFWFFIQIRNPNTNEVTFIGASPKESKRFSKAYKELKDKQLIKRAARGVYVINPKAYIPQNQQFPIVLDRWEQL